ncbi:MAG: VWA domain-containing protein [Ignavibacteriae bacterium]|nr:VWA domain-containing protein [Ignavibacteriota bacterium]
MIRFAHEEYLYLLLLIPVVIVLYWFLARARTSALSRFASVNILDRLAESASRVKRIVKFVFFVAAIVLLVVGLANPQIGTRMQEVKQEGVDLFIALDVSLSMKAEDLKPNRLEKAKLEIRNLIDRLTGDRIGLVVFAGEAYTQFPLTTDYSAAKLFLDVVDVDVVPNPGTSIGAAIERALDSFDFEEPSSKVIVIMTDGENTEGNAFDAAEDAAKKGLRLYTVGMGSPTGAPIPIYNSAGQQVDFKRDRGGSVVVTRLDEVSLEKIAAIGDGGYYRGTNTQDELDEIYNSINALQKREFGVKQFTDFEDRFQYFVVAALLLLVIELLISEKRIRWIARWNPLRREEGVQI